ncbi:MAG: hypothetical protein M9938_02475 [Solirubrobacterales bacterium]|nr:hypothetical protein [Solirubrobacterales bacterium]
MSEVRSPGSGRSDSPGRSIPGELDRNGRADFRDHSLPGAVTTEEAVAAVREVPPEPPPIRGHDPVQGIDSLVIPVIFAIIYGVIGYFVVTNGRIVNFDALNRLNEAYMVWWNAPPKLAAIPLNVAPLGALAFLPLALIKPLATSLVAMPILSAIGGGITIGAINSVLRRCDFALGLRLILLVLFGLNPMFVYYAGNGDALMLGLGFAAVGVSALVSWQVTGETRHVVGAGLAIAVAAMFDYGYFLWVVGFAIAALLVAAGRRSSADRLRSTLLVLLVPATYALSAWILINTVLTGDPLGWINAQSGPIQVNTTGVLQGVTATLGGSLTDLFHVVLGIAPLAFLAVILLLASGFSRDSRLSFGLLLIILAAVLVPLLRALIADQADLMDLSVGLSIMVLATAGTAYVGRSEAGWRGIAALAMGIGLIAALPLGWNAMQNYRFQNQAQAFTRYAEHRDSQEGTRSVGGYTVGIDPELVMARHINEVLPQKQDSILVDENFSYGVMLTSGRPSLFLDRADRGEDVWRSAIDDPFGKVGYMLITTSRPGDQLRKAYPKAIEGGEPGLTPVFRTDRYVLLEVSETRPESPGKGQAGSDGSVPQSTPRPVTPDRPAQPGQGAPAPVQTDPGQTGVGESSPASPPTTPAPEAPGSSSAPAVEGE